MQNLTYIYMHSMCGIRTICMVSHVSCVWTCDTSPYIHIYIHMCSELIRKYTRCILYMNFFFLFFFFNEQTSAATKRGTVSDGSSSIKYPNNNAGQKKPAHASVHKKVCLTNSAIVPMTEATINQWQPPIRFSLPINLCIVHTVGQPPASDVRSYL